ncbi:MAG: peptide chain release factor 2 [Candidatus Wallbacteria bacterium HGW-Wallbacteria-1]|uniref:Peptide chain release factor 2 n=1 Tax=Candidatus Wallbacteria bacterium HGW-Wallbacteria-1 TaxID=2013854 RepID=A0A2N1PTH3_9BACT|nr:MAG: peptide chain release factor 2 [Candidatus Wallbacteria bacterium HGW-Wallbacteria-1]
MIQDLKREIEELGQRIESLVAAQNLATKKKEVILLEEEMSRPDFWNDAEKARDVGKRMSQLKGSISVFEGLGNAFMDALTLAELAEEENDESMEGEISAGIDALRKSFEHCELTSLLDEPHDINNAIMSIHPGAGGVDSQDWAEMLLRMYIRWAEREGFKAVVLGMLPGQEAGIKSVTLRIEGPYAYGYLKSEIGVHRLVRLSPFDTAHRRHTSFASVDSFPEMDEEIEIEIEEKYMEVDTYRSSGAGGQHVNVTDSAVRITYTHPDLARPIVVQCQNERSQHMNRASAMKVLMSKLYEIEMEKKRAAESEIRGEKLEIGWGSQIRSYVLHPYQLVKDLRTSHEIGNVQAVLDGDLEEFMQSFLKLRRSRKS